jgi:Uma2 family endonuclease
MEITFEKKKATVEDYQKLPEGAPFELIEGYLVKEPSPQYSHQDTFAEIFTKMRSYTKDMDLGKTMAAPFDVYLDDENVFQPDILYVAKENLQLIKKNGVHGAPDLILEIISPSNAYNDFITKLHIYEKHGVKEYFIVDPETKEVVAYSLSGGKFKEAYREAGVIISSLLKNRFDF